ncbi:MAG TPA: tetratricopeptide repeat protein [Candidatus Deferrimicrobiaceae bacterium]
MNALPNGFVYDDHFQVENNPWIRDFSHLRDIFGNPAWGFWGRGGSSYYRPLMHLAYAAIYRFSELSPFGYHLVNVACHAANATLSFLLALKLSRFSDCADEGEALVFAAFAAAIFAVHPIHTEVVALIAAIPELLFSLFFILALLAYPFGIPKAPDVRRWGAILLSSACALTGLLCKETAIMVFPVIVAGDLISKPRDSSFRSLIVGKAPGYMPFLAVIAVYLILRVHAFGAIAPSRSHQDWPLLKTGMNAVFLAGRYVGCLVAPIRLNFFHIIRPVTSATDPGFLLMAGVAGAAGILALGSSRGDRRLSMGWALLFLPLAPVLYPPVLATLFGEHNLYLPTLGYSIIVSGFATSWWHRSPGKRTAIAWGAVMFLALLSAMTVARNPVYKSDATLWQDVSDKLGDTSPIHFQRGYWLLEGGKLPEGIDEMKEALALHPGYPGVAYNMGTAYAKLGKDNEARIYLEMAVEENPGDFVAHFALAALHFRQGRIADSVREYETVIRLAPSDTDARGRLETIRRKYPKAP